MKITVEIIDHKGFWHIRRAKSKRLLLQWLKELAKGTEIQWRSKDKLFISQQYLPKKTEGGE